MRSIDLARGLVPLAIVALVAIAAIGTIGPGARSRATASRWPEPSSIPSPSPEEATPTPLEPSLDQTPIPTPELTQRPAPSVEPAPDDDLLLAGRNGVPGLLSCHVRTFEFAALDNPTGAEDKIGPEFDILRSTLPKFWLPSEYGPDPHVREVARDKTGVTFLADFQNPGPWDYGPYIYVDVERSGAGWAWGGTGDCEPRAWAPPGYGAAVWTLDPAFRKPTASTQVLHLLVSEWTCSSGKTAHGRIGPAYVVSDRYEVRIELLVRSLPGEQDCLGADPTAARLRLPAPLGDRLLTDSNDHLRYGTGG